MSDSLKKVFEKFRHSEAKGAPMKKKDFNPEYHRICKDLNSTFDVDFLIRQGKEYLLPKVPSYGFYISKGDDDYVEFGYVDSAGNPDWGKFREHCAVLTTNIDLIRYELDPANAQVNHGPCISQFGNLDDSAIDFSGEPLKIPEDLDDSGVDNNNCNYGPEKLAKLAKFRTNLKEVAEYVRDLAYNHPQFKIEDPKAVSHLSLRLTQMINF